MFYRSGYVINVQIGHTYVYRVNVSTKAIAVHVYTLYVSMTMFATYKKSTLIESESYKSNMRIRISVWYPATYTFS